MVLKFKRVPEGDTSVYKVIYLNIKTALAIGSHSEIVIIFIN